MAASNQSESEKRFFPSGAIFFFVLLLLLLCRDLVPDLLDHDLAELMAMTITQLEKRILWIAVVFVMLLFGFAALAINVFHVGLPTCLTSVKPFQKGELITHSPTHYELHYVARMWKFEPQEVTVPAGSTVDVYLSTADVTHGLHLVGHRSQSHGRSRGGELCARQIRSAAHLSGPLP